MRVLIRIQKYNPNRSPAPSKKVFFFFFLKVLSPVCRLRGLGLLSPLYFALGASTHTRTRPNQPAQPELTHPRPTRELWWVGSGLQNPKTDSDGSVGGFSPLKPASTDPTRALPKSDETQIFRQVFGQNTLDFYEIYVGFGEISPNLVRSQPDLVEISPNLAQSPPDLANFRLKSTILA